MVDFKSLKARMSIEEAAAKLGLETHNAGHQLRGECPVCSGDDRTLVITPAKGVWYCFKSQKGGDLIGLAAHVRECGLKDAAEFLAGESTVTPTVKVPVTSSNAPPAKPLTDSRPSGFDRAKYQAGLDRSHELLKDIPKDFLERADIGVSNRGALRGIVLPLYDCQTGDFLCYARVEGLELPKATVTRLKTA